MNVIWLSSINYIEFNSFLKKLYQLFLKHWLEKRKESSHLPLLIFIALLSASIFLFPSLSFSFLHTRACARAHCASMLLLTCPLSVCIIDITADDLRGSYKNSAPRVGASHQRRGAHTPHAVGAARWPLTSSQSRAIWCNTRSVNFYARRPTFTHDSMSFVGTEKKQRSAWFG